MSKKSKKKLKKKERQTILKSASNSRKTAKSAKPAKKSAAKVEPARNGHAAAKAKKGKLVYYFGDGRSDGDGKMKALLGGKGANLAEMTRIGLPVPPGFTITTEVCTHFNAHNKSLPKEIDAQIEDAIKRIEKSLGKGFGSLTNPLLFAVRSGARDSMPGMMDTILNLGLNDETVQGLISASQNERFAYDCYRRFIQMYGDVVMGVQKRADEHHEPFETVITGLKNEIWPDRKDRLRHGTRRLVAQGADQPLQETRARSHGQELPQRSARAAPRRHRRGLRLVDERARHHLSQQVQHPDRVGHRRQCPVDGVRQHRR